MWATMPMFRMRSLGSGVTGDLRRLVQVAAAVAIRAAARAVGFRLGLQALPFVLDRSEDLSSPESSRCGWPRGATPLAHQRGVLSSQSLKGR
jgi:hypothetical protein